MGFTFDDTDTKGVATPISVMQDLIEKDPYNQQVIFPYIGGEEVNSHPRHAHHRYVINFDDRDEATRRVESPGLLSIVDTTVRPDRAKLTKNAIGRKRATYWWQYGSLSKELYSTIQGLDRVLVISQVTQHLAFAFLPKGMVYSHRLYVIATHLNSTFGVLQSRVHEVWARFFGSSMKDDLMYATIDCFETFPFPVNWETDRALDAAGKEYYTFRAELMVRNDEGLTKTYNRFHDPDERDPDILRLRELHAKMDGVVLAAYGWTDIATGCEFLLDFEIDEEEYRRKKKPWRYRWPDDVRDEVLARLLALNGERAEQERIAAQAQRDEAAKLLLQIQKV